MVLVYDHLNDCACVVYRFIVKRNSSWLDNILPNSVHVFLYDDELQLTEDLVNITIFKKKRRVFCSHWQLTKRKFPLIPNIVHCGFWGEGGGFLKILKLRCSYPLNFFSFLFRVKTEGKIFLFQVD